VSDTTGNIKHTALPVRANDQIAGPAAASPRPKSRPDSTDAAPAHQKALAGPHHRARDPRTSGEAAKAPKGDLPAVAKRDPLGRITAAAEAANPPADLQPGLSIHVHPSWRVAAHTSHDAAGRCGVHPTSDVSTGRFEIRCVLWFGLSSRHLLPRTCHKACPVPVPDARLRSTGRAAARVARTVNRQRLPDVRSRGSDRRAGRFLHDELPCVSCPAEDHPVDKPGIAGTPERHDHRLAPWTGERPAQHLADRISNFRVVQVKPQNNLSRRCF
jgi:hypothetical protein